MMNTLTHCFVLTLFLLSMTTLSARRSLPLLAITNAIMMTCVSMLGAPTVTVLGYSTNVGSIFFATVMYGLTLNYYRFGVGQARAMVSNVLFALVVVYGSVFLLEHGELLSPLFGTRVRIAGAAFISFWLINSFFIALLDRYAPKHLMWRVPLITIAMQAIYNAVFVPCAFAGHIPLDLVLQFAIVGWVTNLAVALCSIPFLLGFHRITRNDMAFEIESQSSLSSS